MQQIIYQTAKTRTLHSIADVAALFHKLDLELAGTRLSGLRNFNRAYLIITRNVHQQWLKNYFDYPEYLQQFDIQFAAYYLKALEEYIRYGQTVPAWQKVFERAEQNRLSPIILMALGVNAHVNNDIAQVLRDTRAVPVYHRDYQRVNQVIKHSIHEVIDSLEDRGRLNPKNRFLRPIYKLIMTYLIKVWRQNAWYKFRKLQSRQISKSAIEKSADNMAGLIARLPV